MRTSQFHPDFLFECMYERLIHKSQLLKKYINEILKKQMNLWKLHGFANKNVKQEKFFPQKFLHHFQNEQIFNMSRIFLFSFFFKVMKSFFMINISYRHCCFCICTDIINGMFQRNFSFFRFYAVSTEETIIKVMSCISTNYFIIMRHLFIKCKIYIKIYFSSWIIKKAK